MIDLRLGDCIEVLKDIPNSSVDCIVTSPPYWKGFEYEAYFNSYKQYLDWCKIWLKECKRLLKTNGTLWVSGTYHSIHPCGFAMQQLNYHILNDIIWFKPNASPNLSCTYFTASHETLLWARKDKKAKHYFNL